jgi:aminopeptidase N
MSRRAFTLLTFVFALGAALFEPAFFRTAFFHTALCGDEAPRPRTQSENFKASPREPPDRDADAIHLHLRVSFDWQASAVAGEVTHEFRSLREGLDKLTLDSVDIDIQAVVDPDGKALKFESREKELIVHFDPPVALGASIRFRVRYRCAPKWGIYFRHPDEDAPNIPKQIWSQGEAHEARHWIPCFDHPVDKLTTEMEVLAPPGLTAISNGELSSTRPDDESGGTWYHWKQSQPHTTYLIAVVVGEFEEYNESWDGIAIRSLVPPDRIDDAARSFALTGDMMEYFSSTLGVRYPWHRYDQICVHEFLFGGMENTTTTILTERTLHDERGALHVSSRGLVAHELAHQWFGDLVTCEDWAHIWINESFATFLDNQYRGHNLGWDEEVYGRKLQADDYFSEDRDSYRRPLVTRRYRHPGDMFDNHAYPKGARILAMLMNVLGERAFNAGLKLILTRHAHESIDSEDVRQALEDASGRSLIWFFDQWIYSGGHPEYRVTSRWDEDSTMIRLTVKQVQVIDEVTKLFRMPVDIEITTSAGKSIHRVDVAKAEETFSFSSEERPLMVRFDKHGWILKELTFPKSREELVHQLAHDDNVEGRILAVRDLSKRKSDTTAMNALLGRLREEPFWGVRVAIARGLGRFRDSSVRDGLLEAFASEGTSKVRVAMLKALEDFSGDAKRDLVQRAIKDDPSYHVVSEALRILAELDGKDAYDTLMDALGRDSHLDLIRSAAMGALGELEKDGKLKKGKRKRAIKAITEFAARRYSVATRSAALKALGVLGKGKDDVFRTIAKAIDDRFLYIRLAVFEALGELGNKDGIEILEERRLKEGDRPFRNPVDEIDNAIRSIRSGGSDDAIEKEVGRLRKAQKKLESRIRKLEGEK